MSGVNMTPLLADPEGRLHVDDHEPDPLLTPGQVARHCDVSTSRPSRWALEFGPEHPHPYPTNTPHGYVIVDGHPRVRLSALEEWLRATRGDIPPHRNGVRRSAKGT